MRRTARYRSSARFYDLISGEWPVYGAGRVAAMGLLALRRGDRVLDIGCGTGLNFPDLQRGIGPTGSITAVDASAQMLHQARLRADSAGWNNVRLIEADATALDAGDTRRGRRLRCRHQHLCPVADAEVATGGVSDGGGDPPRRPGGGGGHAETGRVGGAVDPACAAGLPARRIRHRRAPMDRDRIVAYQRGCPVRPGWPHPGPSRISTRPRPRARPSESLRRSI